MSAEKTPVPAGALPESEWAIRSYRPGDESAIVHLFREVFGRPITVDHWRWKLSHSESSVENVWLVEHEGRPIFHYGGIPCRFQLPCGEQTAMVSVDGMTAPGFRRRGLLTAAARHIYDTWREAGIPFTIGLPNEQWGSRTEALGWQALFTLRWLVCPLRPTELIAQRAGVADLLRSGLFDRAWSAVLLPRKERSESTSIETVRRAGPEFDRLWVSCAPEGKVSVIRDSRWVQWRFLSEPTNPYTVLLARRGDEPTGFLAYRTKEGRRSRVGFVASLVVAPSNADAARALFRHAAKSMYADGVSAVSALAVPGTDMHRMFRRIGFVFSRRHFTVQIVPLATELPIQFFRNPESWSIDGGDFDVI